MPVESVATIALPRCIAHTSVTWPQGTVEPASGTIVNAEYRRIFIASGNGALIITLTFATGMALLSCALNTFYEDVKYLVTVGMYLMLFCCPIMYFVEMVANSKINREPYFWVYKLYNLNPFAALCIAFRKTILAPTPVLGRDGIRYAAIPLDWNYVLAAGLISVATLVLGYSTFNRLKWRFVERP